MKETFVPPTDYRYPSMESGLDTASTAQRDRVTVLHAIGSSSSSWPTSTGARSGSRDRPPAEDLLHEPGLAEHDLPPPTPTRPCAGARSGAPTSPGSASTRSSRPAPATRSSSTLRTAPFRRDLHALGATLLVMTIFDMAMAGLVFVYAVTLGVLPGIGSLREPARVRFAGSRRAPSSRSCSSASRWPFSCVIGLVWVRLHRRVQGAGPARLRRALRPGASTCDQGRALAGRRLGSPLHRDLVLPRRLRDQAVAPNVLLVQVTQSLATLVPSSPGGIGTEQAFIVYVFSGTGVGRATLLALQCRDEADADGRERDRRLHGALPLAQLGQTTGLGRRFMSALSNASSDTPELSRRCPLRYRPRSRLPRIRDHPAQDPTKALRPAEPRSTARDGSTTGAASGYQAGSRLQR